VVFLVFNTVAGWSTNREMMLATRFLSGIGGSAPQAVSICSLLVLINLLTNKLGGGVLSDCWSPEERGSAHALYSLAPFLGPAVGPIGA
jgi:MFS family permease